MSKKKEWSVSIYANITVLAESEEKAIELAEQAVMDNEIKMHEYEFDAEETAGNE